MNEKDQATAAGAPALDADLAELYDQRAAELYEAGQTEEAAALFARAKALGLGSEVTAEQDRPALGEPRTRAERARINNDLQARFEAGSSIEAVNSKSQTTSSQSWLQRRLASARQSRENSQSYGMSFER